MDRLLEAAVISLIVVMLTFIAVMAAFEPIRAECYDLGYADGFVANGHVYCATRIDGTDLVDPIEVARRRVRGR